MWIDRILKEAGRRLENERVVFVGAVGHIGNGILRLLVAHAAKKGMLPRSMTMVDVDTPDKRKEMEKLKADLVAQGMPESTLTIRCVGGNDDTVPKDLLPDTTLILAMTSVPNVVPVWDLAPGTLVVDDSFPLAIDPDEALF